VSGIEFGLASHAAVRWLIASERAIYDKVIDFYMGNTDTDIVEVAGPPTDQDIALYAHKRAQTVPLPLVRLQMKLAVHHLTGEKGVEVRCSDRDLAEIERWQRKALMDSFKTMGKIAL
jgi:hypothetical protein